MLRDSLNPEERIRLEALAQAVNSLAGTMSSDVGVLYRAEKFEQYIRYGKRDTNVN